VLRQSSKNPRRAPITFKKGKGPTPKCTIKGEDLIGAAMIPKKKKTTRDQRAIALTGYPRKFDDLIERKRNNAAKKRSAQGGGRVNQRKKNSFDGGRRTTQKGKKKKTNLLDGGGAAPGEEGPVVGLSEGREGGYMHALRKNEPRGGRREGHTSL